MFLSWTQLTLLLRSGKNKSRRRSLRWRPLHHFSSSWLWLNSLRKKKRVCLMLFSFYPSDVWRTKDNWSYLSFSCQRHQTRGTGDTNKAEKVKLLTRLEYECNQVHLNSTKPLQSHPVSHSYCGGTNKTIPKLVPVYQVICGHAGDHRQC